ncbi:MAG: esterase-like activity of phytase family protein [Rhodoplanes sp.]|uniref:esterase-like activity of phytase family protein n=1 Tax=Rhodoplanes sp. TaxID=1968906 RepID=UPI0018267CF4|nr:esterase-like activity of phytase family protein [Rhodoplanes sp.]NVO17161.1 esterase-like activity of phytase family protein [Rhodoplanes sp.]
MSGRGRPRGSTAGLVLAGALLALLVTGALTPVGRAEPDPAVVATRGEPITVEARPFTAFEPGKPDRVRFGRLQFRGGMELSSRHKAFGGISGLKMLDAERFVAISDKADWLTGRIVYDGSRPVGIADAAMAAMLGPDGRTLVARGWYDTESLAEDQGVLYVGIERVNRIVRFDFARQGVAAPARLTPWPAGLQGLPTNRGIEALVFVPKPSPLAGTLIAISERALDPAGNIKAALIGGPRPGLFTVARRDGFDISDATMLPDGDLLLLERRFTWTTGIAMRLRRIALATLAPGALVDGPEIFFADMGFQIDNMEAISTHVTPTGETVLTIVSDDNFSFLQRTLLLQFSLADE